MTIPRPAALPTSERSPSTSPAPCLSVLVPTRNEAGNVDRLIERIEHSLRGLSAELVFVDDSDDATAERIAEAAARSTLAVTLLARPRGQRTGGLGGAVVAGLEIATGRWVCVMDGDLQHPPELIPRLLATAESKGANLVVASRLAAGGGLGGLGPARRLLSRTIAWITRAVFVDRLAAVTDPMTGFFLVRRDAVDPARLQPDGFKILLEILVTTPGLVIAEVPFRFDARHSERSKAGSREVLRLGRTLARLSLRSHRRLARFFIVGATGFVANHVALAALVEWLGLHYLPSAVVATLGTMLLNFTLTELWVFRDSGRVGGRLRRLAAYSLLSTSGLAARTPLLFLLTSVLGLHYLASNALSIAALTGIRYALSVRWIWRPSPQGEPRSIGGDTP
jgi:putative flippase GtrA